jgi:hypothetical protein
MPGSEEWPARPEPGSAAMGTDDPAGEPDRRAGRRRTYNRRTTDQEVSPPYYEVFERIATALEHIEALLQGEQVTLPDASVRTPAER